eukprot:Skav214682  [mRNA]  locus=scaffold923:749788:762423:+ [translate_table: standard]
MTTVGYGDKVPATKLGQFVGGMTIVSGIVLISLPVAIVGSRFQSAYEDAELERQRLLLEERDRTEALGPGASQAPPSPDGQSSSFQAMKRLVSPDVMSHKSTGRPTNAKKQESSASLRHQTTKSRKRTGNLDTSSQCLDPDEVDSEDAQDPHDKC